MLRINDYVRNGRKDKVIDPRNNNMYTKGKHLRQQMDNGTPQCGTPVAQGCLKGNYWKTTSLDWSKSLLNLPKLTINETM